MENEEKNNVKEGERNFFRIIKSGKRGEISGATI